MIGDRTGQIVESCFSCHLIGIGSSAAIGGYMFYQAKRAKTSSHRFACALIGISFFIIGSHRVGSLFGDLSKRKISAQEKRFENRFDENSKHR